MKSEKCSATTIAPWCKSIREQFPTGVNAGDDEGRAAADFSLFTFHFVSTFLAVPSLMRMMLIPF